MSLKARVEAILFLNEKPQSATHIAARANKDINDVRQALAQLIQEYEERDSGIYIETDGGYCMQVREEHMDLTQEMLPIDMKASVLRTLSTIALKEPVVQSELVIIRGGSVYDHVKQLVKLDLVKKTKEGTSSVLRTTKTFAEYFKLSNNGLELQHLLNDPNKQVQFVRNAGGSIFEQQEENFMPENEESEATVNKEKEEESGEDKINQDIELSSAVQ